MAKKRYVFTKADQQLGGKKASIARLNTNLINTNMQKYINGTDEFTGQSLLDDLLTLTPKDRMNFLMAWMPFERPKLAAIEQVVEVTALDIPREERIERIKTILLKAE